MTVINTNVSALRAQNNSRVAGQMQSQAMERLSSGKRINSAKDDAAGLAIATRTTFNDNVLLNGSVAAGFDIQTGLDTGQVVNITVADLQAAALGVDALDFSTAAGAQGALATLDTAIDTVATERANLGAQQNRLTSAVDNLTSSVTNLSEAKSRIEDADFSVESTNLAAAGILAQASTAMLAQANQSSQGVMNLLR